MCWSCERVSNAKYWSSWKPIFLALKGAEMMMFDTPPVGVSSVMCSFAKCIKYSTCNLSSVDVFNQNVVYAAELI